MKSKQKRQHIWLDTPKAGPVRVTNITTGETHTEPPLTIAERRRLAKQNKAASKRRHRSSYRSLRPLGT